MLRRVRPYGFYVRLVVVFCCLGAYPNNAQTCPFYSLLFGIHPIVRTNEIGSIVNSHHAYAPRKGIHGS
jgi:hypothetical protein